MKQIAGGRRPVAQLSRCPREQGARQKSVITADPFVCGKIRIADQGADTQTPFPRGFDPVQTQSVDIDEMCRRLDLQLHEVQEIGAAGDEFRAICGGRGPRRRSDRRDALVTESSHAFLPATSVMASTMFE